jgi:hypothetical protein
MRLVYDGGYLYWGNLHAGTISRRSVAGGPVEVVAKDLLLAALFPWPLAVDVWSGLAPFVVRDGTVYWIAADSPAVSSAPPDGQPRGGSGTKIMAVSPAGESRPLLPVLSRQFGPIRAVALSPDGGTLYFAEGSSFFAIPSAGASTAAEIRPLGTVRLANDAATVLVADERHLFYPTGGDGWVEGIDFTQVCTKNADGQPTSFGCANWIGGSHAHPLMDTLQVLGSDLYWANGPSMCVGKTEAYITFDGLKGPPAQCWDVSGPVFADVSGFVATPTKVFFGADGMIGEMITKTGTTRLLARDQPHPTSLVTDGKQVYWVTPDCSIATVPAE